MSSSTYFPTGHGYLNPTIKALITQLAQNPIPDGGGGDTPTDLSGYATTEALNTAVTTTLPPQIQGWIRGNGLFRGVHQVLADKTMTDDMWSNFVVFPNSQWGRVTLTVTKPSTALADKTTRFSPAMGTAVDMLPPIGTWTLFINPDNPTAVIELVFTGTGAPMRIKGTSVSGTYTTGDESFSLIIPNGRAVLLMLTDAYQFFYCFL